MGAQPLLLAGIMAAMCFELHYQNPISDFFALKI
jgi:hypothetical protein